jgi:hypothetical protein
MVSFLNFFGGFSTAGLLVLFDPCERIKGEIHFT